MTVTGTAKRICPLCEATCGLDLTLEDGVVTKVRGDQDDPFSKGYLCPKGATFGELAQDPDRLDGPVIKDGDGWREVSWDEAFAFVAERLGQVIAEHGNGATGVYLGNPSIHTAAGQLYLKPLIKALRTRHVYSASTVDQMPKHVSTGLMFGSPLLFPVPDVDRTDFLLMLGANPRMSNGSLLSAPDVPGRLDALRDRGGKLVVVDPRRTRTAAKADQHVAIRPGTDALLLAAMATTIAEEGLLRLGRLEDLTEGLEEALDALAPFTAESVADRTRVPADTIRQLARDLAAADKPVVYGRIGTHTVEFGTLAAWLVDVLNVLVGALDSAGGAMFANPSADVGKRPTPYTTGRWTSRVRGLPEANGELPSATMTEEMTTPGDGQLRALIVNAGNPARSTPNTEALEEALRGLDLLVCVDPYVTATSRHADVILPPPGPLHEPHPELGFQPLTVRNVTSYSPPVLPLPDGGIHEWEILLTLAAIAMGAELPVDTDAANQVVLQQVVKRVANAEDSKLADLTMEEALELTEGLRGPDAIVDLLWRAGPHGAGRGTDGLCMATMLANPSGIDHGPLEPRLPDCLVTASGKVELAPPTIIADVERLRASLDEPDDGLRLIGRRHIRTNNSWGQNIPSLAGSKPLHGLQIHPDDAASNGVTDGGSARLASRVGEVEVLIDVTDDIAPGTVCLPHGFGNDEDGIELTVAAKQGGPNSNELTDHLAVDPLSGNAVLNGIPVTLAPVG